MTASHPCIPPIHPYTPPCAATINAILFSAGPMAAWPPSLFAPHRLSPLHSPLLSGPVLPTPGGSTVCAPPPPTPSLPPRAPSTPALAPFFVPVASHRHNNVHPYNPMSKTHVATWPRLPVQFCPLRSTLCAAAAPSSSPPCVLRSCTYVIAEPSPASDPCPPNNLLLRIASQRPPAASRRILSCIPFVATPALAAPATTRRLWRGGTSPPLLAGHTSAESFCLCACCTLISFSFLEKGM